MRNNIIKMLIGSNSKIQLVLLFLFACTLTFFNVYIGIIALVAVIGLVIYTNKSENTKKKLFKRYMEHITDEMDITVKQSLIHHPIPITIVDEDGLIAWYNKNFSEMMETQELIHEKIEMMVPGLKNSDIQKNEETEKILTVTVGEKLYKVIHHKLDEESGSGMVIIYWMDITNHENLKGMYRDEKPCFAYLMVDNYEDLLLRSKEENRFFIAAQIDALIRQWGQKIYASITRYSDDKYFVVFESKYLERLELNKFAILDEVRAIETGADFPVSLSLGIGVGGKTLVQLDEYATAAMDLALGRGGDQAVVKKISKIEYYGGRLQTVEKRNKGKSRIMAHAIRQLIDQSSNVIIFGHKNPDMDSFGSALGMYRMVKNRNKEAAIILNTINDAFEALYEYAAETKNYKFINTETALALADKDTLVIVLDTHRPSYTECPEILSRVERIVVIDHHRKMEENIENATLTYMEPYASSTSELVAEILQYLGDNKGIDRVEAEGLLAGMTVDTKHFSMKTGVRTFEAASWLRRMGADTASVRKFFQTDAQMIRIKAQTIMDAKIIKGSIAFSICPKKDRNISLLTSQAADELLEMKGIRAAFVAGTNEKGTSVISARSLGDINVQVLMEKLGGGGHLNMAGCQLDCPMEEAEGRLMSIIEEFYNEKEGEKI